MSMVLFLVDFIFVSLAFIVFAVICGVVKYVWENPLWVVILYGVLAALSFIVLFCMGESFESVQTAMEAAYRTSEGG